MATAKKKIPKPAPVAIAPRPLSSAWQITLTSARFLRAHWLFFVTFLALYAALSIILGTSFSSDVSTVKSQVAAAVGHNAALAGLSTYALILGTGGASGSASAYQYMLLTAGSLAVIWALRQYMSDTPPQALKVKDAFYRGMYPLVQFIIVLAVLGVELLPLVAGGALYGLLVGNGIVVNGFEQAVAVAFFLLLAGVSVWLLTRSIFALYIVTLPDALPVQALRDSQKIVRGRQLAVIRKLLFLMVVLLLVSAVVTVPVIIVAAPLTAVVVFVLTIAMLPFVHTYLYTLYRELLA
jgi:hypothetical protein